jgi:SAM-dependent methyltransferase
MATTQTNAEELTESVRDHYAKAALAVLEAPLEALAATCCGGDCCSPSAGTDAAGATSPWGAQLYDVSDRASLPDAAVLASLGCGNPTAVAELREGERVLDLGSGGGIDVLLSAQRVGPAGRAFGLDMTDEMLALARQNAAAAGATNVEFLKGRIEAIPLPASSIDVVISNCVINLSADKPAVLAEMARVVRPGGRIGISDVVADDALSPGERAERGSHVGCIAGALSFEEFHRGLEAVGFTDVSVTATHAVADGMWSAIVRAVRA